MYRENNPRKVEKEGPFVKEISRGLKRKKVNVGKYSAVSTSYRMID